MAKYLLWCLICTTTGVAFVVSSPKVGPARLTFRSCVFGLGRGPP